MTATNYGNGYKFKAIMERRNNHSSKTVSLRRILKSGKPGVATEYKLYGNEKTAEDVIERLETNNPGDHWVVA